jgi:Domain of unknown function (DUF4388)
MHWPLQSATDDSVHDEVRTRQAGHLHDVTPLDLLQSLGIYRRAGHVLFFHPHGTSQLWFRAGEIVDAQSGALRGAAAVHRITTHDRGEFRVEITGAPTPRVIDQPCNFLIFESARRLDEGQRIRERLPAADAVLTSRPAALPIPGEHEEHHQVAALFGLGATLGEVLERSPLGELETLQRVDALVDAGCLEPTGAMREPARAWAREPSLGPAALEPSQPFVSLSPSPAFDAEPPPRRRWRLAAALGGLVPVLVLVRLLAGQTADEPSAPTSSPAAPMDSAAVAPMAVAVAGSLLDAIRRPFALGPDGAEVVTALARSHREATRIDAVPTEPRPASATVRAKPKRLPVPPPEPAARPTPKATVEVEVTDPATLLVRARTAYNSGQGATAYRLASRSQQRRPSGEAAELMTLAACLLGHPDDALTALRSVPLLRRSGVRATCKHAHNVRLKLTRSGS